MSSLRPGDCRASSPEESGKQEIRGISRKLGGAISTLCLVAAALALGSPAHAQGVYAGVLTCSVSSGFGFVFGAVRSVNCTFVPPGGPSQKYVGAINKFGVDLGYAAGGVLVWSVFAPATALPPGSLAGAFSGTTGSATAGVSNVLVGGSGYTISLQPLNIEGSTGNVAANVAALNLTYQATVEPPQPSRIFAGPTQYPPRAFAAYGIVAFTSRAVSDDFSRHVMICNAYVTGLLHFSETQAPQKSQMVTVWPIATNNEANQINTLPRDNLCSDAVRHYGLATSLEAIASARLNHVTLDGTGPFLLAWSPAEEKGKPDALVLVSDLSDVTTAEQAREIFRQWSIDIQNNPALWRNGWNREKIRIKIQLWADKYGPKVLALFGSKE